jgi:VCBS repeat protein/FG-GAP repeat protein
MKLSVCSFLFLSATALCASAQLGSVKSTRLIKPGTNGFVGPLGQFDAFGESLAALGDVDGDGIQDLAVSAIGDGDGGARRGAVWILFLNTDGSVRAERKISQTQGGFTGLLTNGGNFGRRLAPVGDLDGDAVPDLAVLSMAPNRLWVLLLNADGTVKGHAENLYTDPIFAPATQASHFQWGGLAALGDVDGDGRGDLVVGAPHDPDGAPRAGALWTVTLGADGKVTSTRKISQLVGGFTGTLVEESEFGMEVQHLGDLDGDGQRELLVLSPGSQFLGQVWILTLDATSTVVAQRVYDDGDYSLAWPTSSGSRVGGVSHYYAPLGDMDGDGVTELALGFPYEDFPASDGGGLAVAFLRADGSVRKRMRIGENRGGFGNMPVSSGFAQSPVSLGDLDGDGMLELAVGAIGERANGIPGGAVFVLSLASSAVRNGSGANPVTLSAPEPVFGTSWSATLDCSGHGPGMAYVFGYSAPISGSFNFAGELLVGGQQRFFLQAVHASGPTVLSGNIPPRTVALLDLPIHVQGLCSGAPGMRLSNALDLLLGQ